MKRIEDYSKQLISIVEPAIVVYNQEDILDAGYPTIMVLEPLDVLIVNYFGEGGWCDSFYTRYGILKFRKIMNLLTILVKAMRKTLILERNDVNRRFSVNARSPS